MSTSELYPMSSQGIRKGSKTIRLTTQTDRSHTSSWSPPSWAWGQLWLAPTQESMDLVSAWFWLASQTSPVVLASRPEVQKVDISTRICCPHNMHDLSSLFWLQLSMLFHQTMQYVQFLASIRTSLPMDVHIRCYSHVACVWKWQPQMPFTTL